MPSKSSTTFWDDQRRLLVQIPQSQAAGPCFPFHPPARRSLRVWMVVRHLGFQPGCWLLVPSSTMKFTSHQQGTPGVAAPNKLCLWKGREDVSLTCIVVLVLVVLGRKEEESVCRLVLRTFLHLLPVCLWGHELFRTSFHLRESWHVEDGLASSKPLFYGQASLPIQLKGCCKLSNKYKMNRWRFFCVATKKLTLAFGLT